jgi:lysozyme
MSLIEKIKHSEGYVGMPYKDSLGKPTIGYGTLLPLTKEESELLLTHRLSEKIKELRVYEPFVSELPANVQDVISEMCYQLGVGGVLKFKKMWNALKVGNYNEASRQMMDSVWAKQTPNRAKKLSEIMAQG